MKITRCVYKQSATNHLIFICPSGCSEQLIFSLYSIHLGYISLVICAFKSQSSIIKKVSSKMQKDVGFRYSSLNKKQKDIRYSIILNLCARRFKTFTVFSQKTVGFNNRMAAPTLFLVQPFQITPKCSTATW